MTVLHVAHAREWAEAESVGAYEYSSRGVTLADVGFIHCSTPEQLQAVAQRFYTDATEPLVVLEIDEDRVSASGTPLVFEDSGSGELFPHLYGPLLVGWVTAVRPARFESGAFVY